MKKLQIRLTLDDEMGPFFEWLAARPVKVRARELIAIARSGFAVVHGVHLKGASPAAGIEPVVRPPSAVATPAASEPRSSEADIAVEAFGASFLNATPPPMQ